MPFRTLPFLALALLATSTSAQTKSNALGLEIGGAGGVYSLTYERSVASDVHIRAGVTYLVILGAAPVSALWTPQVSLGVVRPEFGAGVVVGASDSPALYSGGSAVEDGEWDVHVLPTASLGIRLSIGSLDLRAGGTALYGVRAASSQVSGTREVFVQPHVGVAVRF